MSIRLTHSASIEVLGELQCWELLDSARIGRLAVVSPDGVDILPVDFMVRHGAVFFRSAPGSKLAGLAEQPIVAFEADGRQWGKRWSVVMHGRADRLWDDGEIVASGVLGLATSSPTEKWNYIRITPTSISGRRF